MLYIGLLDDSEKQLVFGCKDNIVDLVKELEVFKRMTKKLSDTSEFHIYVIDNQYDIDLIKDVLSDIFKNSVTNILSIEYDNLRLDIDDDKIQLLLILKRADCYQFDATEDITADFFTD